MQETVPPGLIDNPTELLVLPPIGCMFVGMLEAEPVLLLPVFDVPLGEGRVDKKFMPMLENSGFNGPISIHVEYLETKDQKT